MSHKVVRPFKYKYGMLIKAIVGRSNSTKIGCTNTLFRCTSYVQWLSDDASGCGSGWSKRKKGSGALSHKYIKYNCLWPLNTIYSWSLEHKFENYD